MPDRLQYELDGRRQGRALRFPPMALLTLVENAVRHGIDPSEEWRPHRGRRRADDDGGACIWVARHRRRHDETAPAGTGLTNLRERLAAFYGADALDCETAARPARRCVSGACAQRLHAAPRRSCSLRPRVMNESPAAPRALIADDEPLLRERLAALLARLWPELQVVARGAQRARGGRAVRRSTQPEIVFLDVHMPGLNGIEAARAIARRARDRLRHRLRAVRGAGLRAGRDRLPGQALRRAAAGRHGAAPAGSGCTSACRALPRRPTRGSSTTAARPACRARCASVTPAPATVAAMDPRLGGHEREADPGRAGRLPALGREVHAGGVGRRRGADPQDDPRTGRRARPASASCRCTAR